MRLLAPLARLAGAAMASATAHLPSVVVVGLGPSKRGVEGQGRSTAAQSETSLQVALVYELLDAHADTANLAGALRDDPEWAAHLEYLQRLHRMTRAALAQPMSEND